MVQNNYNIEQAGSKHLKLVLQWNWVSAQEGALTLYFSLHSRQGFWEKKTALCGSINNGISEHNECA